MTGRAELLRAHIDAVARKVPEIGVDDCGPWVVQWIEKACGKRVVYPVYHTPEEAYALAAAAGGLVPFVDPMLTAIGLSEAFEPGLGDVGIVRLSDRDTAVIFVGYGHCAIRGERMGVTFLRPAEVLKAWIVA